jgi:hypothetical protein
MHPPTHPPTMQYNVTYSCITVLCRYHTIYYYENFDGRFTVCLCPLVFLLLKHLEIWLCNILTLSVLDERNSRNSAWLDIYVFIYYYHLCWCARCVSEITFIRYAQSQKGINRLTKKPANAINSSRKNTFALIIITIFRNFRFRTWWRLFQKRIVCNELYIYIFIDHLWEEVNQTVCRAFYFLLLLLHVNINIVSNSVPCRRLIGFQFFYQRWSIKM